MPRYYVVFDCGTQSSKTAVYGEDAICVAEHSIPTEIFYPAPDWAEMDADHYLRSIREGVRCCVEKSGIAPGDIAAICGDGIICGIVGVDAYGKAITPYIPYLDSRAQSRAEELNENPDPLWIEESGNSQLAPFYPPVLAGWLMNHHDVFRKQGVKVMHNGPYVLSRLADLKAEDAFIDWATLSGWLVGYDAVQKSWSPQQIERLGIPMSILPRIVKPWDIVGKLCKAEAHNMGLPEGIPIVAGGGDTMQSNLGCGLVESGMAADVAGTAAMFTIMVDGINENLSRNSDLLFSIGTLPDTYFYWGYIRTGGLSLRWFRDNVCGRLDDGAFYDEIQEKALCIPPGSHGTLFIPYLTGGIGALANASGCFVNMTSATSQAEMWRAILESIAYEYRSLVDSLRENGISVENVVITEGGSKSSLWNQIKADVLEANVHTLKRSEGALLANMAVAAYAVGDIPDLKQAISTFIEKKDAYVPIGTNMHYYRHSYEVQQSLVKNKMQDAFQEMKGLQTHA